MNRCEKWRNRMVLDYYGDLSPRQSKRLRSHIQHCEDCLQESNRLQKHLDSISRPERREPGEEFWGDFMQRLEARIPADRPAPVVLMPPVRRHWRMAAAAAVLVVFGGLLGRYIFPPAGSSPVSVAAQPLYATAFQSHLKDMRPLVVDCANTPPADFARSLPLSTAALNNLILRNRLLKRRAMERNDTAALALLAEMELILLELSTAAGNDTARFHQVQQLVNQNNMVMQMDLLRRRGNSPKEKRI